MHLRYCVVLVAAFFLLVPISTTHAEPSWINLTLDLNGWECDVYGDFVTVYAVLRHFDGVTGVSFGAEVDPGSGFTYLGAASNYTVTGDAVSGFDIQLGSCLEGTLHVMTFYLLRTSPDGETCTTFHLTPHPGYGEVRYTDCQDTPHRADRGVGISLNPSVYCTDSSTPYRPFPVDGAVEVPLATSLEWSFDMPDCGSLCGAEDRLYFGTTPDPPFRDFVVSPTSIGPLEPETTYYWRMSCQRYCLSGSSPVWSFTTMKRVATKQTTWGAIKALYR